MKRIAFIFFLFIIPMSYYAQSVYGEVTDVNPDQYFHSEDFPEGVDEIVLYSRSECSRCESVQKALTDAGIEYTMVELKDDTDNSEIDSRIYELLPHKRLGYSIRYPIMDINGKFCYSINNHAEFVKSLIEFMISE